MKINDRSALTTERRNPRTRDLDRRTTADIVDALTAEDLLVAPAVRRERRRIAAAADLVAGRLAHGGRLIYVGAGTSGRLGVLDASECPPTYGVPPTMVQGIIAGGRRALVRSVEGAEDHADQGAAAVDRKRVGPRDVLCGIAASGVTPFVHGAMARARERGAATVFVTCAPEVRKDIIADIVINPVVGPEAVTGSTRMKAGTATKLVLNTLTTTVMVRLGKVHGNLMVDVRATNAKLHDRAERMVMELTALDRPRAARLLTRAGGHVKTAAVMYAHRAGRARAAAHLATHGHSLRHALENAPHG